MTEQNDKTEMDELIEMCARAAHEVNRTYCMTLGDDSQPTWEEAPEWQRESAIHGATRAIDGERKPDESHDDWAGEKLSDGWQWGRVKDAAKKTHPCLLPYDQLPKHQQVKDEIFLSVVSGVYDRELHR